MILKKRFGVAAVFLIAQLLTACTDVSTLLAGTAKGYCRHNPGTGPCTQPAPGNAPNAPPR